MTVNHICLIEDDEIMGEAVSDRFGLEGFDCTWFKTGEAARKSLQKDQYGVVISDIKLPDIDGEQLFEELRAAGTELPPYIFMTGYGAIDRAVRLLKLGAQDYLTKPVDIRALIDMVHNIFANAARGNEHVSGEPGLGLSSAMRHIESVLPKLAHDHITVLITGESGVGKEVVARALHRLRDPNWRLPFITVNCAAITDTLLEAEMFGYVKGAYTGAVRDKKGYFEQANSGTLFLDEIGEMPLSMQVKLLRVIQERKVMRVGSEALIPIEINLVCATNKVLKDMVEAGEFREDLYYRINVLELQIPPLRERRDDILWLASQMLDAEAKQHGSHRRELSPEAEQALLDNPWKGNIRELKSCLERACILSSSAVLTPDLLFGHGAQAKLEPITSLTDYLGSYERHYIEQTLKGKEGRIADSAAALGISRKTLWEKMKKLGIGEEK
ncbi:MAG: sigma-54-dependent Fis family transcriptional regulator [Comamonadaceae bacterium CG_4_9_14_3_um_filter_60_33]|nr:MAG: transcriptional regulator [Comamonadaceae bacterium CG2_30_59_20]PIY30022.1 MAG: sigma-54-dependent Fis family transcriptional regulator [Comamonadaceae bacterium CG_4_10_14_3_um_filter_60_42]PJB46724.1 MAG: sigma-54-dependent Fis family transcriptional regulator [Comamonadaceae bacterium CG_4_9_14_3_um_filter_60_33]